MSWGQNESSDSAAEFNPLLGASSSQQSLDDANDHAGSNGPQAATEVSVTRSPAGRRQQQQRSSIPPPPPAPISGEVPSPTSGVHRLMRDGSNLTRPASTGSSHPYHHHQQLRHRSHQSHGYQQRSNTPMSQARQQFSTPPPSNKKHLNPSPMMSTSRIMNSQSLDDADVAAGLLPAISPRQLGRRAVTDGTPRSEPKSRPYSHSFSHPSWDNPSMGGMMGHATRSRGGGNSSTHSGGSRSLGSNTPENPYFHNNHHQVEGNVNNVTQRSYQQHSTDFFNQPLAYDNLPVMPPHAQRMDHGAYGGSEHDFLRLSAASSVQSSEEDAYSLGQPQSHSPSKHDKQNSHNHRLPLPPMPPLEITTNNNSSNINHHHAPYGLETIKGSPAIMANGDRKKVQLSLLSKTSNNFSAPPLPLQSEEDTRIPNFVVLGFDLSNYTRRSQFLISATWSFLFSLLYGYLQELISVELCHRKLGLFLAFQQFLGYTILSYFFRKLDPSRKGKVGASSSSASSSLSLLSSSGGGTSMNGMSFSRKLRRLKSWGRLRGKLSEQQQNQQQPNSSANSNLTVPMELYVGLSILRAIDLGMTNLAMQYVNYPAKTLMKSTRVVFTMIFGVIVTKKRYSATDFGIVGLMVAGLGMFMHADAKTSAVFQPLGIIMLTVSLLCDGAISNLSEALMNQYEVGQDEFIFRLYSIATFFICVAAAAKGDLADGMMYLTRPGTMQEMEEDLEPTWSVGGKFITLVLFSTTGFLGSSTSAAITKSFGALTMSITSTARKATTIFLSFALFPNECTVEHVGGIFLFITSLVAKSLRASKRGSGRHHHCQSHYQDKKGVSGQPPAEEANVATCSPLHLRRKVLGDDAV